VARRGVVGKIFSTVAGLLACLSCGSRPAPAPSGRPLLVRVDAPPPATAKAADAEGALPNGEPVRIGIVHSLTGSLALYEAPLKEMALMTIDELNAEGGVLGRPITPIVVDSASSSPLFAERARELLRAQGARALFGGYTRDSRQSMRPVLEEQHGLLFYPSEYEGESPSPNVAYAGAVPNQSMNVVIDYLVNQLAVKPQRWVMIGTDDPGPHMQAELLTAHLLALGTKPGRILRIFIPFESDDFLGAARAVQHISRGGPTVLVSFLFQDAANHWQRELARQGVSPLEVVSFGIDERQLAEQSPSLFQGTLVASSYFSVLDNPANRAFVQRWARYVAARGLPYTHAFLNDELEATHLALRLWKKAAESANSVEPAAVASALGRSSIEAPSGYTVGFDQATHHLRKPYFIGRVGADGRVDVIFRTAAATIPEARDPD